MERVEWKHPDGLEIPGVASLQTIFDLFRQRVLQASRKVSNTAQPHMRYPEPSEVLFMLRVGIKLAKPPAAPLPTVKPRHLSMEMLAHKGEIGTTSTGNMSHRTPGGVITVMCQCFQQSTVLSLVWSLYSNIKALAKASTTNSSLKRENSHSNIVAKVVIVPNVKTLTSTSWLVSSLSLGVRSLTPCIPRRENCHTWVHRVVSRGKSSTEAEV